MVTETVQAPRALSLGPVLRRRDGEPLVVKDARMGDLINLSTAECHVARVMDGVRYDTDRADLVLRRSTVEYGYYRMTQVFRGHDRHWFQLSLVYNFEWAQREGGEIRRLADDEVLPALRKALAGDDGEPLLRDWYLRGWIPRDDAFVRAWAEATLPADACESITERFEAIPNETSAYHPVTPF